MPVKVISLVFVVFLVTATADSASASSVLFSDNFNDGDASGWVITHGSWHVENGTFIEDTDVDHSIALVQGLVLSTQGIQADLWIRGHGGYGGLTLWWQDANNWTAVRIYPALGQVWIDEYVNGVEIVTRYSSPVAEAVDTWHQLAVQADGATGLLSVSLDNLFFFTGPTTTLTRSGLSGLFSGNTSGFADNFQLTSNDQRSVPEPSTWLLLGTSLAGLLARRRLSWSRT
jgi:hypothetical protein